MALSRHTRMPRPTAPMRRSPMKAVRVKAKLVPARRRGLADRSGNVCEIQRPGCTGVATDACHRIGEGMGGRHGAAAELNDRLGNVLHACRTCHRWTHDHPAAARRQGWMLRNGDNPLRKRVNYRSAGWLLLDDDGGTRAAPGRRPR